MTLMTFRLQAAATQVAAAALPPDLVDWLTKLKLLYGIPFNYLVPDEQLLPMETLRFFQLDTDWINALTDGALSIGRHFNGDAAPPATAYLERQHQAQLHLESSSRLPVVRRRQLSLDSNSPALKDQAAPGSPSGFLLRSAVVSGWKNLDVMGYPRGNSPFDYEQGIIKNLNQIVSIDILRLERLSETVLLGIFQGPLYELVLHEPPEAIHFGFDQLVPDLTKTLRVPTINWDDPNTAYDTDTYQNQSVGTPYANQDARVLDMLQLSQQLGKMLSEIRATAAPGYYETAPTDSNYKDHLVSSDFALEMVKGAGLVSFINQTAPSLS